MKKSFRKDDTNTQPECDKGVPKKKWLTIRENKTILFSLVIYLDFDLIIFFKYHK